MRTRAGTAIVAALLWMACFVPAGQALDYDRNDVRAREVGVVAMIAPIAGAPAGLAVRGAARRHSRFVYFGTEAQLGIQGTPGPWLSAAVVVGGETANDAWRPLRGYGELGTGLVVAWTRLSDLLAFHLEGGVRYQVRTYGRPHMEVGIGGRIISNFNNIGVQFTTSVAWRFD
ncbi:MAG: hypothetical protein EXR79_00465 [Myxococcales bacterium]|nr:hypothetical protein [Myxococcales bacterium]